MLETYPEHYALSDHPSDCAAGKLRLASLLDTPTTEASPVRAPFEWYRYWMIQELRALRAYNQAQWLQRGYSHNRPVGVRYNFGTAKRIRGASHSAIVYLDTARRNALACGYAPHGSTYKEIRAAITAGAGRRPQPELRQITRALRDGYPKALIWYARLVDRYPNTTQRAAAAKVSVGTIYRWDLIVESQT